MDRSVISSILRELNLHEDCVANIYHHGSWVYGTNTPESDRDLIFVTRSPEQKPIQFHEDFDYFHEFELHKLWNQYDICVYSVQNFEILLQKSYLVAIQCVFLPDAFKIKEDIDFRTMYLEKYYNPLRLKQVGFYEMSRNFDLYDRRNQGSYTQHPKCSSRRIATRQLRMNYVFKNLFHGIRYLDFVEQLIRTKSIYNFRRATHLLHKMKTLRGDPSSDSGLER
jgi:predicted nucleotidyltransferase